MKGIPEKDFLTSGHTACPGCGGALALKLALRALGENTVVVIPACCSTIIEGMNPISSIPEIPVFHTAFASAAATASGIKAGFEVQGKDITVVAWAGDGGTFDIGLQALSGTAERNDDIIYICYDNEAYMNTGIQKSSSTPLGAWTTTTPKGVVKKTGKKNMPEILATHGVPYVAVASIGAPLDLIEKVQKAKKIKGFKYIQICAPCTAGWKFPSDKTVEIARLAFQTGVYPLFEIENGEKYTLNLPKDISKLRPIEEYLSVQGRFKNLTKEQVLQISDTVRHKFEILIKKTK